MRPLRDLASFLKRCVLVEGACTWVALAVILIAGHLALDKLLYLGFGPRLALLLLVAGFLGFQLWTRVVRPARIRITPDDVAGLLERHDKGLRDSLASAVAFASEGNAHPQRNSPAMVEALIDGVANSFQLIPPGALFRLQRYRAFQGLGLAAIVFTVGAAILAPQTIATYIQRDLLLRDIPWPSDINIALEGFVNGKLRWPQGDEWTLVATSQGETPRGLHAEFRLSEEDSSADETVMSRSSTRERRGRDQFVLDYGPLMHSTEVRLLIDRIGVDESTGWYTVEAIPRPNIRQMQIEVVWPEYTGRRPDRFATGQTSGDILRGSTVHLSAEISKPVVEATLKSGQAVVAPAAIDGGVNVRAEFTPDHTASYFFDLRDADGLANIRPVTCALRLISDRPPKTRFSLPGAGEMVLPHAVLDLAVESEDDYGLKSIELLRRLDRGAASEGVILSEAKNLNEPAPPVVEALPSFTPRQTQYRQTQSWPLLPLALNPGDRLTLQVRAADFQPVEATADATTTAPAEAVLPNTSDSVAYTLRIVTREELLAELSRREHEWRREFEQVIKAQEAINSRIADLRTGGNRDGMLTPEQVVRYGQEARAERQLASRVKTVRQQFEQIYAEYQTNQLATPAIRRRLEEGVITPLTDLHNTDLAVAAEAIDALRRRFDPSQADELEQTQTRIIQKMYSVLANMLKWEGYNEAVALLQDIIRLQGDVSSQTRARLEREIENMFSPSPSTQPENAP